VSGRAGNTCLKIYPIKRGGIGVSSRKELRAFILKPCSTANYKTYLSLNLYRYSIAPLLSTKNASKNHITRR
jgi:hypothetical protein